MLVTPTMNDKARGFVVTRSFGAAVFIHASGHRPLRVHSSDGTMYSAHWVFAPEARPALELYYSSRDSLNAFGTSYLAHEVADDDPRNQ
jgi:hypothetical protein